MDALAFCQASENGKAPLAPAKAGTQVWIPACAGMSGVPVPP
jgi:hypothetical protein